MPEWIRAALERHVRSLAPVPSAQRIFRAARDYHAASQRCFELDSQAHFLPMPGMILQAFACELYLKALYVIENQTAPARGHELNNLFRRLGTVTQEKIAQRYGVRHEHGALESDLDAFARVFQDWRYAYEFSGAHEMDGTGIAQLASALYEICAELHPDFIQPGQVHDRLIAEAQGVPIIPTPPKPQS